MQHQPPHLPFYSFALSSDPVFDFLVPSGQEIWEILAEIDAIAMAKMSISHLFNIW
jgi:hypothetical protein